MITNFRVQNYKALRDVSLKLTPIHVVIGPNDRIIDHYKKTELLFLGPDENTADLMESVLFLSLSF